MKRIILSLSAVALLFAACKKNDEPVTPTPVTPATPTVSERLVGAWMKTESKTVTITNGSAGPETDNLASQNACAKDDLYNFLASNASNKPLIQTEGATKCRNTDPDTVSRGTYSLFANDTQLLLTLPAGNTTDTFNIVELSGTVLRLKNQYATTAGPNTLVVETKVTYTKK